MIQLAATASPTLSCQDTCLASSATLLGTQAYGLELLPSQGVTLCSEFMCAPLVGAFGQGQQSSGTLDNVRVKI